MDFYEVFFFSVIQLSNVKWTLDGSQFNSIGQRVSIAVVANRKKKRLKLIDETFTIAIKKEK